MDWAGALAGQLLDPFRWALLAALIWTMLRNEAVTGRWLPLAAGAAFVAAIIPLTTGATSGAPLARAALSGFLANVLILAVLLALLAGWRRLRGE